VSKEAPRFAAGEGFRPPRFRSRYDLASDQKRTGRAGRPAHHTIRAPPADIVLFAAPSKSGGWNYHLHCKRPQGSRQQLRPHPGPQAPRHPGPPPHPQRSRPQRSCQQRRPHPHCTSVILSMPAVAAAGSGRIGAAWVVPEPPAKTRPAIPAANSTRNICVHPIFPWLIRSS